MGWWNTPPAWVGDITGWWRAVREVEPDFAVPSEIAVPRDAPPTTFVEVVAPPPLPDGSQHGKWDTVTMGRCGWMPKIERMFGELRAARPPFSWEPCPGCGKDHVFQLTARPWSDATGERFWWEIRRPG